ncbi:ribonuclease-like 3 [Centroberyx affinis]|uniref:ribonuclease-like 3 n=1 Tax=Centroberyx affinis TaxID=166261 RepID=UPI003A5C1F44
MRIQFVSLLLALLCATVLSLPEDGNPRYRKFINQHVIGRMSADRCDAVIRSRDITMTDSNECKETNTFILATTKLIKPICGRAGQPYGHLTKSLQPFSIIVCTLRNQGATRPNCQYRGQARTRRIAIACNSGYPVHFDRDIAHFEN